MIGTVLVGAEPLADLEAVDLRQHDVEDDEIDLLVGEALQCLLAVARLDDAVAVALERIREELLDRVLVVDEQNGWGFRHRRGRSTGARRPSRRTIAPVVAASDSPGRRGQRGPRDARAPRRERRARRGSLDQPINGRLVAGLVAAAARAAAPARAHDRPAGPVSRLGAAAVVRRAVGDRARDRAGARLPRPRARLGGRGRRRDLGEGQARPLRPRGAATTPGTRRSPGSAASGCTISSPSSPARRPTRSSSSRTATTPGSGRARTTTPPARPR